MRATLSALDRTEESIGRLRKQTPAGACCASCFFGKRYTNLVDRSERQAYWALQLLKKQGLGDSEEANKLIHEFGSALVRNPPFPYNKR